MKKLMTLVLSLALAASLCACGNQTGGNGSAGSSAGAASSSVGSATSSGVSSSEEGARGEMGDTLNGETSAAQSQTASSQEQPEAAPTDGEDNPIDQFYGPLFANAMDNATMIQVAVAWRDAWKTELETLAAQKQEELSYPEDQAKIAAFVTDTKTQAAALTDIKELQYGDTGTAPADRDGVTGSGFSSDAAASEVSLYRVAFQQLLYSLNYEDAGDYGYAFDAAAAQSALNG